MVGRVRLAHRIGDLANDLGRVPVDVVTGGAKAVEKSVREGSKFAQRIARDKAGPHGKDYWKRIDAEMTGVLEGEYGPSAVRGDNYVGVGFRNSAPNNDLPQSLDLEAPIFHRRISDVVGDAFRRAEFR